jgi:uncharacterized protein (TIGR02147 family)
MRSKEINFKDLRQEVLAELKSLFDQKKKLNASYSLRAFARDLGISPANLSLVLSGKRALSKAFVYQWKTRSESNKISHQPKISRRYKSPQFIQQDDTPHPTSWSEIALADLTTLKGFKADIQWMAKSLQLTPTQVTDLVTKLVEEGVLQEKNEGLKKNKRKVQLNTQRSYSHIRNFHQTAIKKALVELEKTDQESYRLRHISGMIMAVNPKYFVEAEKRIEAFQQELCDLLTQGSCTSLYQLNFQLFPIVHLKK